jgi:transposase InsO family protein
LLVRRVVEDGWPVKEAAESVGLSERRGYEWLRRFREQGAGGLLDRPSRPHRSPTKVAVDRTAVVIELRRHRLHGRQIAERLRMPRSTVAKILRAAGLSRLRDLEPKAPVVRYERRHPGELVHVDIKKLGKFERCGHRITGDRHGQSAARGIGWEFVHVCIDDASRLAYVEVLDDEQGPTCAAFLLRAVSWFLERGVRVQRVMSDNGAGYRSQVFRALIAELGVRHLLTRAYRPQTNGKAERFIQTLLREWAYERPYTTSAERRRRLPSWLRHYNLQRPHGSLDGKPPISRITLAA